MERVREAFGKLAQAVVGEATFACERCGRQIPICAKTEYLLFIVPVCQCSKAHSEVK